MTEELNNVSGSRSDFHDAISISHEPDQEDGKSTENINSEGDSAGFVDSESTAGEDFKPAENGDVISGESAQTDAITPVETEYKDKDLKAEDKQESVASDGQEKPGSNFGCDTYVEASESDAPADKEVGLKELPAGSSSSLNEIRKSNGLNLNVLSTSSLASIKTNTEPVDNTLKRLHTGELSLDDMTSVDSTVDLKGDQALSGKPMLPNTLASKQRWIEISKGTVDEEKFQETLKKLNKAGKGSLIASRLEENQASLYLESPKDQESLKTGNETLRKTFHEVKAGVEYTHNEELIDRIDWEFWSGVVNDYSTIVNEQGADLIHHISDGIPQELRGMIWQIVCGSKSVKIEDFFIQSKNERNEYEKQIRRDLSRTSFVTSSLETQIEDLYQIIKAYSLFDTEVGYTQGMAFFTAPILINMEPSEAFCLLVKLMFTYGFRDFYLPEMPGLRLRMYQLDRLIEDQLPDLAYHFKREGIKSSMYATQWFLTLFGYKFPLELVLRIFDVVIAEGLESILQFSINLLMINKETLLTLKFESLIDYLKEKIFHCYLNDKGLYEIDKFVKDALEVEISTLKLNKYRVELEKIESLQSERSNEVQDLRVKNGQLTRQIREVETAYAILNKEHIEIANEMINGKMKIGALEDENNTLKNQIEELNNRLASFQSEGNLQVDFSGPISEGIDLEIHKAMERNLQVMEENMKLEEELVNLEKENNILKQQQQQHRNNITPGKSMFHLKGPGKFW